MKEQSPVIALSNVSIFQNKRLVLKNINIEINKGEFVYLIGKTGSGKTTFLKLLYGELPLLEGEATIVNTDLHRLAWKNVPALRRKLGIIFQDFNLLTDRSIYDNLKFVLEATGWKDKAKIESRIKEVLSLVLLKDCQSKMPFELSGGEQQRAVIARALLNEPDIILADEPTGNLDPNSSDEIIQLLRNLNKAKATTIIMATHDYPIVAKYPGKILRCRDNQLFFQETYDLS